MRQTFNLVKTKTSKKTPLAKLATVNIVKMKLGVLCSIRSFRENDKGNAQAEAVFAALVREHNKDVFDADIVHMLDNGNYDPGDGYELFLSHSDTASESVHVPTERLFTSMEDTDAG